MYMRKVTGKGVGTWLKSKVWFSINSDLITDIALMILIAIMGVLFVELLMIVMPD